MKHALTPLKNEADPRYNLSSTIENKICGCPNQGIITIKTEKQENEKATETITKTAYQCPKRG